MKKLADRRGADEAPSSLTAGIESGRGVVSMRVDWLKLQRLACGYFRVDCMRTRFARAGLRGVWRATYRAGLPDMLAVSIQQDVSVNWCQSRSRCR